MFVSFVNTGEHRNTYKYYRKTGLCQFGMDQMLSENGRTITLHLANYRYFRNWVILLEMIFGSKFCYDIYIYIYKNIIQLLTFIEVNSQNRGKYRISWNDRSLY